MVMGIEVAYSILGLNVDTDFKRVKPVTKPGIGIESNSDDDFVTEPCPKRAKTKSVDGKIDNASTHGQPAQVDK